LYLLKNWLVRVWMGRLASGLSPLMDISIYQCLATGMYEERINTQCTIWIIIWNFMRNLTWLQSL
jgi:hypothetical protein